MHRFGCGSARAGGSPPRALCFWGGQRPRCSGLSLSTTHGSNRPAAAPVPETMPACRCWWGIEADPVLGAARPCRPEKPLLFPDRIRGTLVAAAPPIDRDPDRGDDSSGRFSPTPTRQRSPERPSRGTRAPSLLGNRPALRWLGMPGVGHACSGRAMRADPDTDTTRIRSEPEREQASRRSGDRGKAPPARAHRPKPGPAAGTLRAGILPGAPPASGCGRFRRCSARTGRKCSGGRCDRIGSTK